MRKAFGATPEAVMASPAHGAPIIYVLAGVNGAGKSSIGGAALRQEGSAYFNPDEAAARIRKDLTIEDANALAWNEGTWRLEEAIESRSDYAFESTLGGNTIPALLTRAAEEGFQVMVWFVGHDITEVKIREQWETSLRILITLLPLVSELKIFDDSKQGVALLLHWREQTIVSPSRSMMSSGATGCEYTNGLMSVITGRL